MILFMRHSYQRVEHFPAQFEQMECESCSGYILKNLVEYIYILTNLILPMFLNIMSVHPHFIRTWALIHLIKGGTAV